MQIGKRGHPCRQLDADRVSPSRVRPPLVSGRLTVRKGTELIRVGMAEGLSRAYFGGDSSKTRAAHVAPLFGSFANANSAIWSHASGEVHAVRASNMSLDWWRFADYRSAIGSGAPGPTDAIDASRGIRVVGGREHTQTDNDNNR